MICKYCGRKMEEDEHGLIVAESILFMSVQAKIAIGRVL